MRLLISALEALRATVAGSPAALPLPEVTASLLPRLRRLLLVPVSANSRVIRVGALLCLAEVCARYYGEDLLEEALAAVREAVRLEPEPAVAMSAAGLLGRAAALSGGAAAATLVLPAAASLVAVPGLSQGQLEKVFAVVDECVAAAKAHYLRREEGGSAAAKAPRAAEQSREDVLDLFG